MLLASVALAAELPWECPSVTAPEDGLVYAETDAGLAAAYATLVAAAEAATADCVWSTAEDDTGGTSSSCDSGTVSATRTVRDLSYYGDSGAVRETEDTLEVELPTGDGWTRIRVSETGYSWSSGESSTWSAEWDGVVEDLPADGWLRYTTGISSSSLGTRSSRSGETESCGWTWEHLDEDYWVTTTITTPDQVLEIAGFPAPFLSDCYTYTATLDGALLGAVDPATWVLDPGDLDADGFTGAACDCDETDATVNGGTTDTVDDGIDQDCDGVADNDLDLDDDGFSDAARGGDDCDDTDTAIRPGANDPVGDGRDQDCDGADDVDGDGDGFTADGDDWSADCDDTDATVSPGKPEVPYDGVDQDCSGADLADVDEDGFDAVEAGGDDCDDESPRVNIDATDFECDGRDQDCDGVDECPEEPDDDLLSPATRDPAGCTTGSLGGGAWPLLLVLPLLAVRRRRSG